MTTDKTTQTGEERMQFGPNGSFIQNMNSPIVYNYNDYGNRSAEEVARIQHSLLVLQQQYLTSQQTTNQQQPATSPSSAPASSSAATSSTTAPQPASQHQARLPTVKNPFPTPGETPSRKSQSTQEEQESTTEEDVVKITTTEKTNRKAKKSTCA
jgi:hypothetical protein